MKIRVPLHVVLLLSLSSLCFGYQEIKPQAGAEDPVAKERAAKQKQLNDISKITDNTQKRELLEKYLQENPNGPHLTRAYSDLGRVLLEIDPAKVIELADQLLARPEDPKEPELRKQAYGGKFRAYQKLKNDQAIKKLGDWILETQSDPSLLHDAAEYDKENALKLYEKAIAEKEKEKEKKEFVFPDLRHLYNDYANELSRKGYGEKALEYSNKAVDMLKKDIADLEALPEKDAKRRRLSSMGSELAWQFQSIARMVARAGAEKGLEYLTRAEEALGDGALDQRGGLQETRAKLYEAMDNSDKALQAYVQSFAFGLNPNVRDRIQMLAKAKDKPVEEYFAEARKIRETKAPPFKPFELKNLAGEPKAFHDLKSKVTLVNFFFPT